MFTDVNSFLKLDLQSNLPLGFVGICENDADSAFLIHHFLSSLLKNCPVCLISFTQSLNHFNTVGNKIGCNITMATKQKQFLFVDGLKILRTLTKYDNDNNETILVDEKGKINIRALLHSVIGRLDTLKIDSKKVPSLIIDNLSVLIDIGCPVKDVIFFVHYLRTFFNKFSDSQDYGHLVIGVNNDLGDEDEEKNELWKYIQHSSVLSLLVSGLNTGYCREVHGQVGCHCFPS